MENEQANEVVEVADMKLLSGRAHEYVVNFRNRFLTYFALPLFLLFILLALAVSWTVYVPTRSEHAVTILKASSGTALRLKLGPEAQQLIDRKADKVQKSQVTYLTNRGSLNQLDCQVTMNGSVLIENAPTDWYSEGPVTATLVLYIAEDRFIHKLLDELAKNLKVKKPPVTQANQP